MDRLKKKAGIYADTLTGTLTGGGGYLGQVLGATLPYPNKNLKQQLENSDFNATSLIPIYGGVKPVQKRRMLSSLMGNSDGMSTAMSETFGQNTSGMLAALLLGLATAGIGKATDTVADPVEAGLLGANLGFLAGPTAGSLAALFTPTRTDAVQQQYERGSKWKNWVVPGVATYNMWKAKGKIHSMQNEAEERNKAAQK